MDERLPINEYLRRTVQTTDGWAWLCVCALSFIAAVDLLFHLNWLPLRERQDLAKTAVLLAISPLLTFLVLVVARQLPLSGGRIAAVGRAAVVLIFFLVLNF